MEVFTPPSRRRNPMRLPAEAYPILTGLETHLPQVRAAERRALTWWVLGAILAGSACQSAVLARLTPLVGWTHRHALRQQLREVFKDGVEQATPAADLDVAACFAPLLGWVLRWWRGEGLALALDATLLRDRLAVVAISVLYRGTAIPVAWAVLPGNQPGAWLPAAQALFARLAPAVPKERPVLVLADRGLWSPRLWGSIRAQGWRPLLRIRPDALFQPDGCPRQRAATLVPGPGHAWAGAGVAFRHAPGRQRATLLVVWAPDQAAPWLLLTDLAPTEAGVGWYGLRVWIELGFRSLKSLGWQWERTRRLQPERVARHLLVAAIATLWVVATGTREEDAERRGRDPAHLRVALPPPPGLFQRQISLFARGLARLGWQLLRQRRLWTQQWLWPEPWPGPPPGVHIVTHQPLPS
jgi:hypothetical protein